MIPGAASLLRIYTNAHEKWRGVPLYRAVVESARRLELAGASVFPVEVGYGAHRLLHDIASEYSSFEIPIVVEIVDAGERVGPLLAELETMVCEGLIVVGSVQVVRYTHAVERDPVFPVACGPAAGAPSASRRESGEEGLSPMKIEGEAQRVTVYLGSADTWHGRNLALAIVERCRALGMAGATVSRGVMGFGKHSVIHKAHFLGLSEDLPEKIEVVDRPEEIRRLLPVLDEMLGGGLIVVEDVHVLRYVHAPKCATRKGPSRDASDPFPQSTS
jgi:PII-like signaling protein